MGKVPDLAFIAPNQCNDMHGRGNGTAFCNDDADDNGTQVGLNPTLDTAFGLPCLNHACDEKTAVMTDLFAE